MRAAHCMVPRDGRTVLPEAAAAKQGREGAGCVTSLGSQQATRTLAMTQNATRGPAAGLNLKYIKRGGQGGKAKIQRHKRIQLGAERPAPEINSGLKAAF